MPSLQEIAGVFSSKAQIEAIEEDSVRVNASFSLDHLESGIEASDLRSFLFSFPRRDKVNVVVRVGALDGATCSSSHMDQLESQLSALYSVCEAADGDEGITVEISISKSFDTEGAASIYSEREFFDWLTKLSLKEQLSWISDAIAKHGCIYLNEQVEGAIPWGTPTVRFNSFQPDAHSYQPFDRQSLLLRQSDLVNFSDASTVAVSPYDLVLVEPAKNKVATSLFNSLLRSSMVIAVADHCRFEDGGKALHGRFRGVRVLDSRVGSSNDDIGTVQSCYSIFSWLYSGGEISDKAGLLRNIISLRTSLEFDDAVLHSARSGYELYLKENISRYIDLKNRVTDYLDSVKNQMDEKVDSLTKTFSGSVIAMITFFVTVIISQSGQGTQFSEFVGKEVLVLSYAFGIVSLVFLISTNISINSSKERIRESFLRLKKRYSDLFCPEDLSRVFSEEEDLKPMLSSCSRRQVIISGFWILTLIILLWAVTALANDPVAYLKSLIP